MKKISTLFKASAFVVAGFFCSTNVSAQLTENFDNVAGLTAGGWSMQNLSTTIGTQANWFQGNATVFPAFNGATTAYIAANFNFTTGTNTISGWLITPQLTIRNGDVVTFYSRKVAPDTYPDRLEMRMSTNGASTNAGATSTSVGDFTTVLLTINPTLVTGVYPIVWTQYTVTISGLAAPASGRFAFRYFVTGGGPSGANSDFIGIDAFVHTPYVCPTVTVTGTTPNGTAGTAYNTTLSNTGTLGAVAYAVTAGALPVGLTLSAAGVISGTPTATGTFNFTVTVTDASGCTGSQAYSITIICPTGGATLSTIPAQCSNGGMYTLVEGSPAGGTYSGTGVSGGMFDPSVGTQTITYTVIDVYGCTQVANGTATVNTAPAVTLSSFTAVCDNGGMVTLTGESPAGGTWSGTNVSGNMFDPTAGTQTIMYMYTDGNGCSNMAMQSFPVNTAPTVTLASFPSACSNDGMLNLVGESPVGGTWSGTGVTGNQFDPTAGTQSITYMYTDANGCSNMAMQTLTVNTAPVVTASSTASSVCPGGSVTLTGGGAATYTWDNSVVDGVPFTPAATMTYIVSGIDGNGCSDTASIMVTVNSVLPVMANASPSTSLCAGNPVTLTGSGALTYSWDNSVVDGVAFTPASTASYIVTGTDANGCVGSDTIMIIVNPLPTVSGSASSTTVCASDAAVTLTGTPTGGTWSGPGVTGTSFTPATAGTGTHTATYQFTDANGCDGSATVTITVNACVGIAEASSAAGFIVYPNPTTGIFTIVLADNVQGAVTVNIMSVDGKLISSEQRTNNGTAQNFDLSSYPKGIYLLEVQSAAGRSYSKIVLE